MPHDWMLEAADEWVFCSTGVHNKNRAEVQNLAKIIAWKYEKAHRREVIDNLARAEKDEGLYDRMPEAHAPATPATPTREELAEALRKAVELVWEHHEIGHIRRTYEQGAGSCELCKESRLLRIGEVLERYDKRVAEAAPTTPELLKQAEEFWAGVVDPPLMKIVRKLSFEDCRIVDKYVAGAMADFALTHRVAEAAPITPERRCDICGLRFNQGAGQGRKP